MNVLREIECEFCKIFFCLLDLNLCELIFYFVKDFLDNEVIERSINKELFEDFWRRVLCNFSEMDIVVIDRIIESMFIRIKLII